MEEDLIGLELSRLSSSKLSVRDLCDTSNPIPSCHDAKKIWRSFRPRHEVKLNQGLGVTSGLDHRASNLKRAHFSFP